MTTDYMTIGGVDHIIPVLDGGSSTASAAYQALEGSLVALIDAGRDDSPEADAIRDTMDAPWLAMSQAERNALPAEPVIPEVNPPQP